jgi:ABC-type transport system substrate-binding protein
MGVSSVVQRQQCLRVGIPQIYPSYDPSSLHTTPQVFVINSVGGTLLRIGDNNQYYSAIAESWVFSDDGREITLSISPQAKFSNGEEISPKDIIASLKRTILYRGTHMAMSEKIEGSENLADMSTSISGLSIAGPNAVRIRTKKKEPNFLAWLSFPEVIILPEHQAVLPPGKLDFTISSGAYSVTTHTEKTVTLKANPYFYEPFGSAAGCIEILPFPQVENAIAALKQRKVDLLDYGAIIDPEFADIFSATDDFTFTNGFSKALLYFVLNPSRPAFQSLSARRSFLLRMRGNRNLIPYGEGQVFFQANQFLPETQTGHLAADEANALYSSMDVDRKVPNEMSSINILYPEVFGSKFLSLIEKEVRASTGASVRFVTYKEGEVLTALQKNDYDAFFFIVGMGEKDTEILLGYHFENPTPLYNFQDKVLKERLHLARQAINKQEKIDHYKAVSARLIEQAYIVPIAHFSWPIIHSSSVFYDRINAFQLTNSIWRVSWR